MLWMLSSCEESIPLHFGNRMPGVRESIRAQRKRRFDLTLQGRLAMYLDSAPWLWSARCNGPSGPVLSHVGLMGR